MEALQHLTNQNTGNYYKQQAGDGTKQGAQTTLRRKSLRTGMWSSVLGIKHILHTKLYGSQNSISIPALFMSLGSSDPKPVIRYGSLVRPCALCPISLLQKEDNILLGPSNTAGSQWVFPNVHTSLDMFLVHVPLPHSEYPLSSTFIVCGSSILSMAWEGSFLEPGLCVMIHSQLSLVICFLPGLLWCCPWMSGSMSVLMDSEALHTCSDWRCKSCHSKGWFLFLPGFAERDWSSETYKLPFDIK